VPIVDCDNRVFCVASPPPSNEDWKDVNTEAASALERERDGPPQHQGLKLNEVHRRGRFGALSTGFSANGGMQVCANEPSTSSKKSTERSHKSRHRYRQMKKQEPQLLTRRASHQLTSLVPKPSLWAPPFRTTTFSIGQAAILANPNNDRSRHLDHLNYIYGWCGITALGEYDYTKGGHLILWDLRMVIKFPPGWTILIPSSYLRHGNTAIAPDEKRFSFTQYTSGSLLRYAD
ncbi:hypothetical protein K435DRAFT_608616, partial [Dendrothele bispora CBS 962.96]